MAAPEWVLVVGADGTLIASEGGAPTVWQGARVEALPDMPAPVRAAVDAAIVQVRDPARATALQRVEAGDGHPGVTVVAVEAIRLRRTSTDVRALLTSCLAPIKTQVGTRDVSLELRYGDGVPARIWVDPEKVGWAVAMLAGSAFRYVRPGSHYLPGGTIVVQVSFDPARDVISVAVTDDGPGIPANLLGELFARKAGAPAAVGLSLSLAQEIARAHGGEVSITSRTEGADHGTTVRLEVLVG